MSSQKFNSKKVEVISKKKPPYPLSEGFKKYLKNYGRLVQLNISYQTLLFFENSIPVYDAHGKDTLWESTFYKDSEINEISNQLKEAYALLKSGGDQTSTGHLKIEKIDYCTFGNSRPFRIKIINILNDVYDYFYIKVPDASRILGLEIDHIIGSDKVSFLVGNNTLVEEHIPGIPGDFFIDKYLDSPICNKVRLAKEFVKFNQRCFIRLLGDMRSYNFVFDITPDFDDVQIRIRPIDFDQQCYEGRKNIYLPQYYKENGYLVNLVSELHTPQTINQYQQEEKASIARRITGFRTRLKELLHVIEKEELSTKEKIRQLREELADTYEDRIFLKCETMGMLLERSLKRVVVFNVIKSKY